MASVCPNVTTPEWKALVAELDNSRIKAYDAFKKNEFEIPDIKSDLVQEMRETNLKQGPKVDVVLDKDGRQTDAYKDQNMNKVYKRISKFVNNFAAKTKDSDESIAERKANRVWAGVPKDEKIVTEFGKAQTWEEYKDQVQQHIDWAIAKGLLMHLAIQQRLTPSKYDEIQLEIDSIIQEVQDERGIVPFSWEWIKDENVIPRIFKNLGINTFYEFKDSVDDVLRDEVMSEVSVASDIMGLAGTVDMLVRHSDNTYSVVDWKTGKSLNKVFSGLDSLPMKYGTQPSLEIEDSIRNRAKLQIALYAVLLRSQNPGMQFRRLSLAWIPNRYDSLDRDPDMHVDAWSFIPMIEQFLKDPKMAEKAGLPRNVAAQLLKKDPTIFDPRYYSNTVQSEVLQELRKGDITPEQLLEAKLAKLQIMVGGIKDLDDLSSKEQSEAISLIDAINSFKMDAGHTVDGTKLEDLSPIELYLGNYSEVTHPMVQSWKKFKDEQEYKVRTVVYRKMQQFNALWRPVMREYEEKNGVVNVMGNKAFNYDKLWAWAYTDAPLSDETSETIERLLTNTETDPKLIARWEALSSKQKALLNFVNKEFEGYFNGPGAFLRETATIVDGKDLSHLDLYNREKDKKNARAWYSGFFFKVPPTDVDIATRAGNGNYYKGKLSKKNFGSLLYKYSTFFQQNNFENWENKAALPLKYLGNDFIDSSRSYTKNLEIIFHEAISELEKKRHLDGVYALGLGIKKKLQLDGGVDGQPYYDNLIKFMDMKLLTDIQRKLKMKDPRHSGRSIRVKMLTPHGWQYEKVSMDSVMKAMIRWASMNTMWLRPWQGTGNGVHATLLTHRDGLKGSISSAKFMGIEGGAIDFTEADIAKAEALYVKEFFEEVIFNGDIRKGKMFLFAKEFDYFGNNFDYAQMEKTILSLRNRHMGESMMYLFHSKPEEFVSLTTMTAQLLHLKNARTGKSIWESYAVEEVEGQDPTTKKKFKEHKLVWKGGVRGVIQRGSGEQSFTEELHGLDAREQAKLRKVHERLQGGYRKDEALYIEAYVAGKMMVHLKKYLPRLILNFIHKKRSETDLGYYKELVDPKTGKPILKDVDGKPIPMHEWVARTTEGRLWTMANVIGRIFTNLNIFSDGDGFSEYKWSKLAAEQKQNLIEAMLTLALWVGAYGMYIAFFEDMDDDDTRKKWWRMYLMDNLSQQYNVVDLARTMKTAVTPVALSKLSDFVVSAGTMAIAGTDYARGNNDEAFTQDGDLRGWNRFQKGVPYLSSAKDLLNRFDKVKDDDSVLAIETIRLK